MSLAMLPVTLPRFASTSQLSNAPQSDGLNLWGNDVSGELDFDMLAEYLLDEGTSTHEDGLLGLSAFDFK